MNKQLPNDEITSQYKTYLEIQHLLLEKHKRGVRTGIIFICIGIGVMMLPAPWKIIGWILITGGLMGLSIGVYGQILARKTFTLEELQIVDTTPSPDILKKFVKVLAVVLWGIISLLIFTIGAMWISVISNH